MSTATIQFVTDIPRVQARRSGSRVAVNCEGRTLTYAQLEKWSDRAAGFLQSLGVQPGDRVAWMGRPGLEWFELFFGVAKTRACFVPINTRLSAKEIAFIVEDSGANLLFVTPDYVDVARAATEALGERIRLICAGEPVDGVDSYDEGLAYAPGHSEARPEEGDDILQLYTSGTTGVPKGVRLNQRNYATFLRLRAEMDGFQYAAEDTVLIAMPLFHVAGANVSFAGLAAGARLLLQPEFKASEVLAAIGRERIGHAFLAPVMINALLQAPEAARTDFRSLKSVSYGASPIAKAVLEQAASTFGCGLIQFYGMTETTGAGTTLRSDEHEGELFRACGRPWPETEVRVADAGGQALGPNEIGEIEIRGPAVTPGYWRRPEVTAATIRPDGWLRTGDAGYRNADGYFFIYDRVKDMIVSGGENVYPAEVENAIAGCPGVADVAVVGVPDDTWGEAVKAIVVRAPSAEVEAREVIAWARSRIAGYKSPKSVDFVEALPRNAAGKVLRRELRAPYWAGLDRQVA